MFTVRHTGNQGGADASLALPQQGAQAVDALIKDFGIDAKRVGGKGVASFVPVANNGNEDGPGKNRRMKMAEQ